MINSAWNITSACTVLLFYPIGTIPIIYLSPLIDRFAPLILLKLIP